MNPRKRNHPKLKNANRLSASLPVSKACLLVFLLILLLAGCKTANTEEDSTQIAITHVSLVPMTSEIILKDQTVIIEESRIVEIGPTEEVKIFRNAIVIDGSGTYLMPGLADMHMHTSPAWETDWPVSPFALFLANGVTTVRNLDPLGDGYTGTPTLEQANYALTWRNEILTGTRAGPTMYLTGISLQGPEGWRPSVIQAGDAANVVRDNKNGGYDFLKIFEYFPAEHYEEAMAAAEKHGFYLTGHIPMEVGLEDAVAGGMDEIAHIIPILIWDRVGGYAPGMTRSEFMQQWQQTYIAQWAGVSPEKWILQQQDNIDRIIEVISANDVVICTTVAGPDITKDLIEDHDRFIQRADMQYSRQRYLDLISRGEDSTQQAFSQNPGLLESFTYERDMWLNELKEAGVLLILGTDAGIGMGIVPGFSAHLELQAMVNNGFTPYEAIATGTVNASKVVERMIGINDFGTIEVGKRVDLILIGGNPLTDVSNIQDILGVIAAGRWFSRESLDELLVLP